MEESWSFLAAKAMVARKHVPSGPDEAEARRAAQREMRMVVQADEVLGLKPAQVADRWDDGLDLTDGLNAVCVVSWTLPEHWDDDYRARGRAARAWSGPLPAEGDGPGFLYIGTRRQLEALGELLERTVDEHGQRPVRDRDSGELYLMAVTPQGLLTSVFHRESVDGPLALAVGVY